jgi:hypothetical protein
MIGVWRSLLWKEWREQRWKALLLLVAALPSLAIPYLGQTDAAGILVSCLTFTFLAASLFLGAGAAASEQSQRTVGFLQSLPISTKWSAIAKLASALTTLWLPIVIFFIANQIWRGRPSYPAAVVPFEIFAIITGLALSSLLIWMAAVGVNLSDEIRAGAIGFLVIVGCWALVAWLPQPALGRPSTVLDRVVSGILPGGVWFIAIEMEMQATNSAGQTIGRGSLWPLAVAAILSNSALAASYVWRFGRVASPRRQPIDSAAKSIVPVWLAPPMRRPWKAILWKQICESLPLALMGAGAILCVSLIIAAASRQYQHGIFNDDLLEMSIPVWMMVGGLVSIVSGIGLWLDDLRPELHSFWRSRPVSPDLWFAVKFASSAVITIGTLALPSLLIYYAVAMLAGRPAFSLYASDDWSTPVVIGLLSQFGFFCVAAASMATIRRPMVAALLTILLAAIVTFGMIGPLALEVAGIVAAVAAISGVAVTINWLSVHYDWAIGR